MIANLLTLLRYLFLSYLARFIVKYNLSETYFLFVTLTKLFLYALLDNIMMTCIENLSWVTTVLMDKMIFLQHCENFNF